jgi:archaemetzincin
VAATKIGALTSDSIVDVVRDLAIVSTRRRRVLAVLALLFGLACEAQEPVHQPLEPRYEPAALVSDEEAIAETPEVEEQSGEERPAVLTRGTVILIPLESFPDDLLDTVEAELIRDLQVEVLRHDPVPLPKEAWYEPRRRYRADKLLEYLDGFGEPHQKVLGLTEVDISTTNGDIPDWGIFGLANMPGHSAVVSSKRLLRKPKNRDHVKRRVGTVAVHEVGHTFGLDHCGENEVECVMVDAEGGIENTDTSSGTFGPECRAKLNPTGCERVFWSWWVAGVPNPKLARPAESTPYRARSWRQRRAGGDAETPSRVRPIVGLEWLEREQPGRTARLLTVE